MTRMTRPLPKWLTVRYALLWKSFSQNSFGYEEARQVLKDKKERLSVILSELRKHGWLTIQLDPSDARKRMYYLKNPEEIIEEMAGENLVRSRKSE